MTSKSLISSFFINYQCESSQWDTLADNSDVGSIVFSDLEHRSPSSSSSSSSPSTGPIESFQFREKGKSTDIGQTFNKSGDTTNSRDHGTSSDVEFTSTRKRTSDVDDAEISQYNPNNPPSTQTSTSSSIFKGLNIITTPPTDDSGDFLQGTDPAFRRQILGIHETNRRNSKYLIYKKKRNNSDYCDIQTITSSETTTSTIQYGVDSIKLIEPFILRTSIYEKFLIHFQNLYNEHDALAISTLLMYPCCKRDMTRELCGYQRIGPQNKLSLVWKRTEQGDVCFLGRFELMFSKAPDCIMLFHKVKCHYTDRGTAVIAPYSYFLTVTVPLPDHTTTVTISERESANSPVFSTGQSSIIYKEIRVEIAGCSVYYYNCDNLVVKLENHLTIKQCSDPGIPVHILVKCLGM